MDENIVIKELTAACDCYVQPICRLLSQLTSSTVDFTIETLETITASDSSHLFVAECNGEVVGMLTLGEYMAPTGRKMWIEDVVVDEAMRGRSLGRRLVEYAMVYAAGIGGCALMLTSRPSRLAANALYRSCGFGIKETNMYKKEIHAK